MLGGYGSVQAMLKTLKNNANLRRRRKAFEKTARYKGLNGKALEEKVMSEKEMEAFRQKLRVEGKARRRRLAILAVGTFFFTALILWILGQVLIG